jgi:hypothetical protein
MALVDVVARAEELERLLRTDNNPADALDSLQAAMQVVLQTIQKFAPPEPTPELADIRREDASAVIALLTTMSQAWDNHSTKEIRQAMKRLEALVPHSRLAPIQGALDGYDFQAGAARTQELMVYVNTLTGDT